MSDGKKTKPAAVIDSYKSHMFRIDWMKSRYEALWATFASLVVFAFSAWHLDSALSYTPIPQQIVLDMDHRPIERQDLKRPATHNPQFRVGEYQAAEDFAKYALLTIFTYTKEELELGTVRERFVRLFAEDESLQMYEQQFLNLSQQKIVIGQDGLVRTRLIGDLNYVGSKMSSYIGVSGRTNELTQTYKFTGKMLMTVHATKDYPNLSDVTVIIQRAKIQDKMMGYQVALLEVK